MILILVVCGCSQDFYPNDPNAKPIPILYGFIDTNDSIHSIRLTKTFFGPKDANELAKDTLNLLYDSVKMVIECMDSNLKVIDSLTFHKTYFTPPPSGVFNTGTSWYYVSTDKFPESDAFVRFRLKAIIYDSGDTISTGNAYRIPEGERAQIVSPDNSQTISVYNERTTVIFLSGSDLCGTKLRLRYSEVINDCEIEKSIEQFWLNPKVYQVFYLTPAKLYMFIRNNIPANQDVDFRIFRGLDIFTYGTYKGFVIYSQLFNTDRSFLSDVTFFETPYSNIKNGYGMFYEYSKDSITNLMLDQKTLDSLANGQITKDLKFVRYQ